MKKTTIFRYFLAIVSFAIAMALLVTAAIIKHVVLTPSLAFFGFSALLFAIILAYPEVINPLSAFFSRIITTIIYPDHKLNKPPLSFILARRYTKETRYDDAIHEYKKIIHFYPKEIDAYKEIIPICKLTENEELALKYQKKLDKISLKVKKQHKSTQKAEK